MSTKKLSPEEELEKQYSDYKAQFEQWKEKNKGSEHTEGYINYVKQFKEWEKSVETRRIAVRNKSQQERQRQEAAQNEQRQRQDETAAAARYAKQQEQYMSVHVRALEEQERIRKQKVSTTQSINSVQPSEQQAIHHTPPVQQSQPLIQPQHLKQINFGLPYSGFEFGEDDAIKRGPHIQADPQPLQSQQNMILPDAESKILLWGEDGFDYLPNDPMNCQRVLPLEVPSKTTGFPSVSIVSSAVSNKQALYQWQKQMIKEYGKSGLNDGELTLVDWKTINADSMKSQTAEQKLPADLYDNPIQLAAYVASVNAHPEFEKLPTIKQAAVVLVYEDGRGVEVVRIDSTQIEVVRIDIS
ncbi:hypothetical protein M3Y96_00715900 [Aphelenchoides besseyi]|nr:hypothetical protein M3Y96_00715900 [Aphelenchoides besseyi]